MKNRGWGRWGLLFGLVGVWAVAQEPVSELAEPVAPELRPTLAVLSVTAADRVSRERARLLQRELLSALATSEQFSSVISPHEIHALHGKLEVRCTELACFEAARARLQAERVARLIVAKSKKGSHVTLLGLHGSELLRVEVDVGKRGDFVRKVLPQLRSVIQALATPHAKLIVENADPALPVLLDNEPVGTGRIELIRPPGELMISIGASAYEPYDRMVTLKPGETRIVELRLLAKPVAPVAVQRAAYSGLMSRPGTYLAMSGATMLAVGLGLGIASLVTEERLASGPSVPVTRAEALNAPAQAKLAGFLLIGGAALSAGGILWVALTPTKRLAIEEPTGSSLANGWTFAVGGKL